MAKAPGVRRRDINNCRRKIPYRDMREARKAARLVRQLIHELVLAYPCPLPSANHAHIGHPHGGFLYLDRKKKSNERWQPQQD